MVRSPAPREAAGLTQVQLANRLGVTYQAVQKWERSGANPTVATIQRVLRALDQRVEMEVVRR
jgi:transcriptional regulator with XRE-family HTH domain